jgi:hypothetical protein
LGFRGFFGGLLNLCGWFAVLVGASSFILGLYDIYSTRRFSWTAIEVEATVTRVEERPFENNSVYRPTLSIVGDDGRTIEYVGDNWVSPKPHEPDEVLNAYYEPNSGIISSEAMFRQEASFSTFRAKFGAAYFLFGAVLLWLRKRRRLKSS